MADIVSQWLSGVALLFSGLSLLIAYLAYRRAGPRLGIAVRRSVHLTLGSQGGTRIIFHVLVHNAGRGAITIRDVGLIDSERSSARITVEQERRVGQQIQGPKLPHRLVGEDFAEWDLEGERVRTLLGDTYPVRGFAQIVNVGARRWRRIIPRRKGPNVFSTVTAKRVTKFY